MRQKIQMHVDEFIEELGYRRQLRVSEPYRPYHEIETQSPCPHSDSPGVYIFCSTLGALYIGKSSRYMGNRIWYHFGRLKLENEQEEYPNAENWIKSSKPDLELFTIPVPEQHWWLASALEGYLTEKLRPQNVAEGRHS